jgi:hypothetical protein
MGRHAASILPTGDGGDDLLLSLNLDDGHTVLKVGVNNPAARLKQPSEASNKRYSSRRKPQSAAAEDITFALVNSGMFGQSVKRNEDLQNVLQARSQGRVPGARRRRSPPPQPVEPKQEVFEVPETGPPESHLHIAVREGHMHSVKFLLEQEETDMNATDGMGNTPLHLALEQGQEVLAALLVQHGAGVNVANALGRTPLHLAALAGMEQVVQQLIKQVDLCTIKVNVSKII